MNYFLEGSSSSPSGSRLQLSVLVIINFTSDVPALHDGTRMNSSLMAFLKKYTIHKCAVTRTVRNSSLKHDGARARRVLRIIAAGSEHDPAEEKNDFSDTG